MASENESGRCETLADLVSDLRAKARKFIGYHGVGWSEGGRLMSLADRIEAAWRREKAEWEAAACACVSDAVMSGRVAVEHEPVGNAAAMREALNKVGNAAAWIAESCNDQQTAKYMNDMIAIVQSALSAPARNCDRFTSFEQARTAYCSEFGRNISIRDGYESWIFQEWLFAPAEERKGEGK